jgi:hypothetical protein
MSDDYWRIGRGKVKGCRSSLAGSGQSLSHASAIYYLLWSTLRRDSLLAACL